MELSQLDNSVVQARPSRQGGASAIVKSHRRRSLEDRVQQYMSREEIGLQLEGKRTRDGNGTGILGTNPTIREIEVLIAKVDFGTNFEAALELGISEQTVKNHVGSVMLRLGASTVTHVIWMMWPVLKDYWLGTTYHPRPVRTNQRLRRTSDPERRMGVQRRKYIPPKPRATYNPAGLSYAEGYVEHIGDLCGLEPDADHTT